MKLIRIFSAVVLVTMMLSVPVIHAASISPTFSYQGSLNKSDGTPVTDPSDLTFSLYTVDSLGAPFWSEQQLQVVITNGRFATVLGLITPITPSIIDSFSGETWLGIKVGANPEMTPRQKLTSVPFAFNANHAVTATNANVADLATKATNADLATKATTADKATLADLATNATNAVTAATAVAANNGVPKGAIIMWSGTVASIPAGWAFCDGANGTPDLRKRFVIASGGDTPLEYTPKSIGGSKDHFHKGTGDGGDLRAGIGAIDSNAGTIGLLRANAINPNFNTQLPSADHFIGSTMWDLGHPHVQSNATVVYGFTGSSYEGIPVFGNNPTKISGSLPPWYALAYIMKL